MIQSALKQLFDPRGRLGRAEMLLLAAVLIGLEITAAVITQQAGESGAAFVFVLKSLMVIIGLSATIKRLHDMGYSGWWVLGGAGILCMWTAIVAIGGLFMMGREVLQPGSAGHLAILGLVMLPAVGMTLWLHVATGETYKNEYGHPSVSILNPQVGTTASSQSQANEQDNSGPGIPAV
jgi:uncharacterized membrane protein YhaH (DUF805 family)